MRNSYRHSRGPFETKWIWLIFFILILLFAFRYLFSGNEGTTEAKEGLSISGSGQFVIIDKDGDKRDVAPGDVLSREDKVLSILTGVGILSGSGADIWVDKKSELSYISDMEGAESYKLTQGRSWIEAKNKLTIALKHIDADLSVGSIALVEQQPIHSIIYILRGSATVRAPGGKETTLTKLNRIMVSQSDLANPGTTLSSLSESIDDSIKQNAFFLARGGVELLEEAKATGSGSVISSSGSQIIPGTGVGGSSLSKYIVISRPTDGSKVSGSSFRVEGYTNSPLVKSIRIDDLPAIISGTGVFVSSPISVSSSTIDIVYKAYDEGGNLLERGLLSVLTDAKDGADKLVPTTFPVSDKDFRFISPKENPYKTSLGAVTVSGVVPKGAVEYITVNGYRLKKFTPYSASWYYYANTAYQTMKEGFNLYEIRFYGPNNTLLSTQLFTIIKEGGSVSGE